MKKDVLRTDRTHNFYSGPGEENKNVITLLNLLTTFALNHKVKYCQGMSDLASPILYAMKDEAQAYICFCSLMTRLNENFNIDGEAMSKKFENLTTLLQYYDPEFFYYLKQNGAQELLFCYRWILLELKREFAFDDALHMLEVLWSSIPNSPIEDLPLFDENYRFKPISSTENSCDSSITMTNMNSLSLNSSVTTTNSQVTDTTVEGLNSLDSIHFQANTNNSCLDNDLLSAKLVKRDELFNNSSGRGSMAATFSTSLEASAQSLDFSKSLPSKLGATRSLRTIRFLPRILSNDSREIDSPDEDEFEKQYFFPPRFIEKQFSVDEDEIKRLNSFDEGHGDVINSRIINPSTPSKHPREEKPNILKNLSMQSNDAVSFDCDDGELMVHCNGEYMGNSSLKKEINWSIPRGLARSISCDSLKSNDCGMNNNSDGSSTQCLDKNKSEGYLSSCSTSENNCGCGINGNKSNSSSCSSLVILSSTGSVVDSICTDKYKVTIPSPNELGLNNAFMLFLCLTLLLQHRDKIMAKKMDSNEIAMYFDGFVRKHNVHYVLDTARHLYHSYLSQWHQNSIDDS